MRRWQRPPTTTAPAVVARPRSSSSGLLPIQGRSGRATLTRKARSRCTVNSSRVVSRVTSCLTASFVESYRADAGKVPFNCRRTETPQQRANPPALQTGESAQAGGSRPTSSIFLPDTKLWPRFNWTPKRCSGVAAALLILSPQHRYLRMAATTQTPLAKSEPIRKLSATAPLVEFLNVSKTYKDLWFKSRNVQAVQDVSFRIEPGEVFGLLGPNRAGKTTLVKLLLSLCRPTSGTVTRFGQPLSVRSTLARVGHVHENHAFPRYLTAVALLEYYGALTLVS